VILIGGAEERPLDEDSLRGIASEMHSSGAGSREIMDRLVMEHGAPRNLAYRLAHEE
jgi:hypothetical protein